MTESDPRRLFRGTAGYYARHRPGYPPALIAEAARRFGLDGTGRVLDLGCGTGQLALPLAAHAAHVIGVDPEPEMLAAAESTAKECGVTNATWHVGGDRDLPRLAPEIGVVRLAAMGQSFHWMEQDATLAALAAIVAPGGGVLIVGATDGFWSGTEPWQHAARAAIQRWLGPRRRAGSGHANLAHEPFEVILARSAFSRVEAWRVTHPLARSLDAIVGHLFSTSYASPAVLGEQRAGFEADVRATLAPLAPDGLFRETMTVEALFAWRP